MSCAVATNSITVPAERSQVFAVIADPATYPHWLAGARRILSVDDRWPDPGTSFRHVVGIGPLTVSDTTVSLGALAPSRLEMQVRARPFGKGRVRFELDDVDPATAGFDTDAIATRVTIVETPDSPLLRLMKPLLDVALQARNGGLLRALRTFVAGVDFSAGRS